MLGERAGRAGHLYCTVATPRSLLLSRRTTVAGHGQAASLKIPLWTYPRVVVAFGGGGGSGGGGGGGVSVVLVIVICSF